MKKITAFILIIALLFTCVGIAACNTTDETVKVTLHYCDEDKTTKQLVYNYRADMIVPTRGGYDFVGWFYDSEGTRPFVNGTQMSRSFDLYAKWEQRSPSVTHTVVFVYNDGTTPNETHTVNDGMPVSLPTPNRGGYRFDGWWTQSNGGTQWTVQPVTENITLYARWTDTATGHTTHDFGDSYFMFVKCRYEGCTVVGRKQGTRNYDNEFTFNESRSNAITNNYNACVAALNGGNVQTFYNRFSTFEEDIGYLDEQYYWAMIYIDSDDITEDQYNAVANCYDDNFLKYYELFVSADKAFGTSFWNLCGENREEILRNAEQYTNEPETDADNIMQDYRDALSDRNSTTATFDDLYGRFVAANNELAASHKYDNYIEYSYKADYNREYSPSDTEQMHQYVKQYVAPAMVAVENKLDSIKASGEDKTFYNSITAGSIISSNPDRDAVNYIGNYFKWLNGNVDGSKNFDFYSAVNEMFRVGNYFSGTGEGAFTTWMPYNEMAVVYLENDDNNTYDNAFTFVHEFGHYYESVHNGGLFLSYDHDETQSQGNEMLFLAWLKEHKPDSITTGMTKIELNQLSYMLWIICMASAVDELEQAAYTGVYNGEAVTGDYHDLFGTILDSYGREASEILKVDQTYWYYVVFDSAAYYISYAMSALPSLDLYTIAETDGLLAARDVYFKLFTYCEDEARMQNYSYSNALEFCGLDSPFSETLYQHIYNYVETL